MVSRILMTIAIHVNADRFFIVRKPKRTPKGFTTHVSIHRVPRELSELGIAINQDIIPIIIAKKERPSKIFDFKRFPPNV
jgi:hypothetical protein